MNLQNKNKLFINKERKILSKKQLDLKLKIITKKKNKNLKEIKKKQIELENEIKLIEEKNKQLDNKRERIYDKIVKLEVNNQSEKVVQTIKFIILPPEIFDIILKYCCQKNPVFYLINKSSYKYLNDSVSNYFKKKETDYDLNKDIIDPLDKIVYERVPDLIERLRHILFISYYDGNVNNGKFQYFNYKYNLNENFGNFFHYNSEKKKKDEKLKLRRFIFLIDIFFYELIEILRYTLPFHEAVKNCFEEQIKLNKTKTIKWSFVQTIKYDKNKKPRRYNQRMDIVLEKDGGFFNMNEYLFKWFKSMMLYCFNIEEEILDNDIQYGKFKKIKTSIRFV